MHACQMISLHPHVKGDVNEALARCIEECYGCAQACTSCGDACLGEDMVQQMTQCIRLNMDCADICIAAGAIATRRTGSNEETIRRVLDACATACRLCGEECAVTQASTSIAEFVRSHAVAVSKAARKRWEHGKLTSHRRDLAVLAGSAVSSALAFVAAGYAVYQYARAAQFC